jgi:hypothetical protein
LSRQAARRLPAADLHCKNFNHRHARRHMRKTVAICLIVLPCWVAAYGQEQESKLSQRLLEPNMKLGNDAQNKKFTADKTSVNKRANVNTFYIQQKAPPKQFSGTKDYSAKNYDAGKYNQVKPAGNGADKTAAASEYREATKRSEIKSAYDSSKQQSSRDYAGTRPYLEKGKSQKSLERKNKPMTIDEVRELLNKNK